MNTAKELAAAWEEYATTIAAARDAIETNKFFSEETAPYGYLYLAGVIDLHHDIQIRAGDPRYPRFYRTGSTPGRDSMYSNADTFYLAARIDGAQTYRISGRLGTVNQTIIGTYVPRAAGAIDRITGRDLELHDDGTFDLIVSPERPRGAQNWLASTPDATTIAIYQTYGTWDAETRGLFTIHNEASLGVRGADPTADAVAARLRQLARNALDEVAQWRDITHYQATDHLHTFSRPEEIQVAMLGARFSRALWRLDDDDALLIEAEPPSDAIYWGWATYNLFGTHLDFANRQTSLNHSQARVDDDGILRIVLSAHDPGFHNWLDIGGHPTGRVVWRVSSPREISPPRASIVPVADINRHLPAVTATITAAERAAAIEQRQRHVARRYAE